MTQGAAIKSSPVLQIAALESGYGPTTILRGVSLVLGEGEMVTIIGPNGSGKSTLIKSVFGLADVFSGSVALRGEDVTGDATNEMVRRGVGYVPQAANVFPTLSVQENIEMGAFTMESGVAERVTAMRDLFPVLDERWGSPAGHLSGGQRQILALARALVTEPSILLLDEPTAGLAPQIVDAVLKQVREINERGVTVLLVEQNAVKALRMSDRAYVLARGMNFMDDTADSLLANPDIGQVFLGLGGTSDVGAEEESERTGDH